MAQKIREIMTSAPVTCNASDTVADAAQAMKQYGIGDVIVLDGDRLHGTVTDRDLVVRVIAEGRDPQNTILSDICSRELETLSPDDDVNRAVQAMADRAVRRIPIVDDGKVVGLVSIGDLAIERDERSALASVSVARPNT